jgi:protein-disulfide isomerase
MSDSYECEECGQEFDSERGLHIHAAQVHEDEEVEKVDTNETESSGEERNADGSKNFPVDERTLQIPVELALFSVFVLGVAVGLSTGIMAAGSGLDLGEATGDMPGNGDDPGSSPSDGSDGSGSSSTVDVSAIEKEGEPVLGESDAPVTMVVYEDFQCPFCNRFENGAIQQVVDEYVESGEVKIMWKDFPLPSLGHNWAEPSARTMECVYRQDNAAFWDVKNKIFDNQNTISEQTVEEQIIGWASQEKVSESAVRSCLENGNPMDEVSSDKTEGRNFDVVIQTPQGPRQFVSGTPSSVIYAEGDSQGEPIIGAQPFDVVQKTIDSKLEG